MKSLWKLLDGWKSIIGYLLMSIPGLTTYPMLVAAIEAVLATPSKENTINAIVQLVLALGIGDRLRKKLRGSPDV